jgi:L,D-peptidoglycan transpeptidase YkuD (ErfK/YbiS/YcfS/YnhG family)
MGWCDDISSKFYNKLIRFPFIGRAEKLYLRRNIYDIILTLNFNTNPTRKNKGSAIFIHIASKKYNSTKGCVAISKINMRKLLKYINRNSRILID